MRVIHVINYYSFTNLSELKTNWQLLREDKPFESGTATADLAPRLRGDLKIAPPPARLAQAEVLRVVFDHPVTGNVVTYDFRLKPEPRHCAETGRRANERREFPAPELRARDLRRQRQDGLACRIPPSREADQHHRAATVGPGQWVPVKDDAALYAMPLAEVAAMDADLVIEDDPAQAVVGHVHAGLEGGTFSYRVDWTKKDERASGSTRQGFNDGRGKPANTRQARRRGSTGDVEFRNLAGSSSFPHRMIIFPGVGRDIGPTTRRTTSPGSGNRHARFGRRGHHQGEPSDAFDFNSTKYNCEWASLADSGGKGIAVIFNPGARHQVRSGTPTAGTASWWSINIAVRPATSARTSCPINISRSAAARAARATL